MESLRELFIKLGLSVNAAEFAEGLAWEHALEEGAHLVVEAVEHLGEIFIEAVEKTAEFGEQMSLLSIKTGVGVESIQKLSYAASLSGSTADDMRVALVHLARSVEAAKDGSEQAQKHFTKLGISMADVSTKSPEELFLMIADRAKAMGAGTKLSAAAMDLFGRSGANLIPTLIGGREELESLGVELEDFGSLMGEDSVNRAREFNDNLKRTEVFLEGLRHELGMVLIDGLEPIIHGMLEWVKANRQLISQKLQTFARGLVQAIEGVVKVVKFLGDQTQRIIGLFKLAAITAGAYAIATGLVAVATGIASVGLEAYLVNILMTAAAYIYAGAVSVVAAVKAAAAWALAAAPVLLVTAALVLAALAAEDLYYFLTGGDSVIGHIINTWGRDWSKFIDDFTKPVPGEWWLTAWMRQALAVVMDLEGHLGALADLIPAVGLLHVMASKSVDEKGYGSVEDQQQRIRTMETIYGNSGSPMSAAEAQAGSNFVTSSPAMFSMPVTIVQGPGQSAGAVADAIGYKFEQLWDAKMRQAQPSGGR